jgi:hypothetical protein
MDATVTTNSDNDWLRRAGTRWENDKLVLPHAFLMLPMTIASKAVVSYNADSALANRISQAVVISVMVRCADTAFFNFVANLLNSASHGSPTVCHNCLRGQLFANRLKELRKSVNHHIIHKIEDGTGVGPTLEHIPLAIQYYDEMFTLPLTDPISWPERRDMQMCQKCAAKVLKARAQQLGQPDAHPLRGFAPVTSGVRA